MSLLRLLVAGLGVCGAGIALANPVAAQDAPVPLAQGKTAGLSCDNSIVERFKPNALTKVLLVRQFRKGEALPIQVPPYFPGFDLPKVAEADLCLVKVLVGPGNPGPAGAPSTSAGIGVEILLPAKDAWTGRVHAIGTGGFGGGVQTDLTQASLTLGPDYSMGHVLAAREGSVVSSFDTGHAGSPMDGSFLMNVDGTINTTLWKDYSSRAVHEQAVVTKALATAYYGKAPRFSYFEGGSGGGRQALALAQRFPQDYDGLIAAYPAVNLSKFVIADLYPQLVIQRDLGGKYMSNEQLNFVSNAAIAACDVVNGKHLGFIINPEACRYDPTKDLGVLCANSGGKNETPTCLTRPQALAINKFWYGMTTDGSVPDPAVDNGFGPLTGKRRGYGNPRGSSLLVLASHMGPFDIAAHFTALALQDPKIATPTFKNAIANGADGWKGLSYQRLAQAYDMTTKLQPQFDFIDATSADLSAFKARGGKIIQYHGTADSHIPYAISTDYYQQVITKMNGLKNLQDFYRLYLIHGLSHGPYNGTSNPAANPPLIGPNKDEAYGLITDWVEKGIAPDKVVLDSVSDSPVRNSLPMCAYPARVTYVQGDIHSAASYVCGY